ncbi:MAG: polymer-forming cytoskeletal protein [Gammaproteobacteria bacterium]|nr:polymer-forming cytoskeletal protein [Gammaproteobacteria bacterium]MDE2263188.1 polymer-forming cytoskeletal protein [Gammaproteobacteria bacterium]
MFNRDSKPLRIDTLIAKSVRVNGDVEFAGGLHLDGQVSGGVRADSQAPASLSVSDTGSIEGSVEVTDLVLHGTVRGDIVARGRVVLGASARVEGNVYYGVIEMTLGAQITGKLVRLTDAGTEPGAAV